MFKSVFIKECNLKFEEIPVGNDAFLLRASELATDVLVIKNMIYCYTYNPKSITYSIRTFRKELDYLDINLRINNF